MTRRRSVAVCDGRSDGLIVRRPSVMPQPDGWTRPPEFSTREVVPRRASVLDGATRRPVVDTPVGARRAWLVAAGAFWRPLSRAVARDATLERSPKLLAVVVRRRTVMPPLAKLRSFDLNVY